jgi:YVTN family beta-propeller protein
MLARTKFRPAALAAVLFAAGSIGAAVAQTVGTRIPVGTSPSAIAVNPVTNKVYVTNEADDTVTVINANDNSTKTVPVGDRPLWIAINAETNRIYASNLTSANTSIIDGATDTVELTTTSGGGGWTAINPINDTAYVVRFGAGDEVNVIQGTTYVLTFATRSFSPVGIAVNPVTNWLYNPNSATGDVSVVDATTPVYYPPLKCPNGSGGFKPQPADPPLPPTPDPYQQPCVDIPGTPVAVAINPVSGKSYAVSSGASGQISVITNSNSTFTTLNPPGAGTAITVAVNPVANMAYAVFSNMVVAVDSSNTMTIVPSPGGPVAIGVNPLTNMIYVPNADGSMLVINGQTGATNSVTISSGANGIAVNPLTNMVYVLDIGGGVTPVSGAAGTATSTGITTTITPLPGNNGGTSGTITVNASSSITPAPLDSVRKVYYRFGNSGPWTEASGTGPYPVTYSGFAPGSYTLNVFATNGLEAPNINTHLANVPVVGNVASYNFTVSSGPSDPARLANIATRMRVQTGDNVLIGGFIIGGSTNKTVVVRARGPSMAAAGVPNTLANPQMQLYSGQTQIAFNDDWGQASNAGQITASGLAPDHPSESAIMMNLAPGAYSAIVTGVGNTTGVGIIEVFEVDTPESPLINIATRGQVLTGDDVMIGGFIIQGSGPQTVVVRARGPSLAQAGVPGVLQNPVLQLFDGGGALLATNDDWQTASNASTIQASGFAPSDASEAAILMTLQPGAYSAIVTGANGTTGVAIVEVFDGT